MCSHSPSEPPHCPYQSAQAAVTGSPDVRSSQFPRPEVGGGSWGGLSPRRADSCLLSASSRVYSNKGPDPIMGAPPTWPIAS